MSRDPDDPKSVIADAYAIADLTPAQARSIFLDWALSVEDPKVSLPTLIARHGAQDHPMTAVLQAGLGSAEPKRRGGRAARLS